MASLIIDTGAESHPQIEILSLDLQRELVNFRWLGGPHDGECAETFVISTADHGDMTVNEMIGAISAGMVSLLPE